MTEVPRRVLVTGVSGSLGRATADLLAHRRIPVTGLDLRHPGGTAVDRMVVGSAGDAGAVRQALAGVDAVIHLAALPAPVLGTPEEVFCGNTRATFVVLEEAGIAGVRRAAIASSMSALGLAWADRPLHPAYVPVDERIPLQVEDPYGLSKEVDELTAAMMTRRHGMATVALRFPRLGGPEDKLRRTAGEWALDPGAGAKELWSYLDVRDAARAAWLAISRPVRGHHVVTVAAPNTLATRPTEELLDTFHPETERRAELAGRAAPVDLDAAERLLGFKAEHVLP
ncbi:NAD-dependent epimerase/dehydratase family protein [Nonomuraea sp. NPDC050790]|uniref:NAD-dependent epimerase/dehydratase family protein n=1 Tax=Nonomuraea sp. NPDC050790 TaxID=3364371 RepID=UPI00379CCE06